MCCGDERLSGVSSAKCELLSDFACLCVETDQQLASESDTDCLRGFACLLQLSMELGEVGIVPTDDLGDDEQDGSDAGATAAHLLLKTTAEVWRP